MCDPLTIAGAALAASGQVVAHHGQAKAAAAHNAQAQQTHMNASVSASRQYGDLQRKYNYESRSLQQEGFNAVMAGRAASASAVAQAGSAGIAGNSLSIRELVAEQKRIAADNVNNLNVKREDTKAGLRADMVATHETAKNRIDSTPFQKGPSLLALGINLANTGVNAYQQHQKGQ